MRPRELQTFLYQCDDLEEGESIVITKDIAGYMASAWLNDDSSAANCFYSGKGLTVAKALAELYANIELNHVA